MKITITDKYAQSDAIQKHKQQIDSVVNRLVRDFVAPKEDTFKPNEDDLWGKPQLHDLVKKYSVPSQYYKAIYAAWSLGFNQG